MYKKIWSPPPDDADNSHPLYGRYAGMRNRCNNPNNRNARRYHNRGIRVCPEWEESFLAYVEHVESLERPSEAHNSLDRIDNDKGYEPGNLRWATAKEQSENSDRSNCGQGILQNRKY